MATKNKTTGDEKSFTIDMPDVKDIPGQENVVPPRMREMEDVTISSSDEEGEGILDEVNSDTTDDDADELSAGSDVGDEERKALAHAGRVVNEETEDRAALALDNRDEDGELLNENADARDYGEDLDVPGSDLDDSDEELGEEDEENNTYSNPD
ncbi:MAG: hypothetical protein EOO05_16025 [Chitinophagaceae bacterium]|nr:MAG: hypothetical protein EOO05_16025 [Chitinophagaceae bacterium]